MSWPIVKISDLSIQVRGVSYTPDDASEEPKKNYLPILRANNITETGLIYDDLVYVNKSKISDVQILREGDIVIAASSGSKAVVGKASYFSNSWIGSFGAFCKVVRPSKKVHSKYLGYYFQSTDYRTKISHLSAGANINNIRNGDIDNLEILLPPIHIQRKIVDILENANELRKKDQQLLIKYDELLHSIFKDMFGDPIRNEKRWELVKLKSLIRDNDKINYGVVQPGDDLENGVPIVRVGDLEDMQVNKENLKRISPQIEKKYPRSRLTGDEILIGCVGSIGRIAFADDSLKGYNIVRATARIRVNERKANRQYIGYHLSSTAIQNYFMKETRTVSQPTLNISHIEETPILLPPNKLQNKFASIAQNIQLQRQQIKQQMEESENLFQSLLQRAFNGELIVN